MPGSFFLNFFKRFGALCIAGINLLRVGWQSAVGYWRILKLPQPVVSIFGGSRIEKGSIYARQAHEIAERLAHHGVGVLTGGGPGIMEAASCAAIGDEHKHSTLAITTRGLAANRELLNKCVRDKVFVIDYLFARRWLLIHYSVAYAVFPGGIGTLNELTELLTLMQLKEQKVLPVVLIGKEYWQTFMVWVDHAIAQKLLDPRTKSMMVMTDDTDEAVRLLEEYCSMCNPDVPEQKPL